jgi:hypothetical protein
MTRTRTRTQPHAAAAAAHASGGQDQCRTTITQRRVPGREYFLPRISCLASVLLASCLGSGLQSPSVDLPGALKLKKKKRLTGRPRISGGQKANSKTSATATARGSMAESLRSIVSKRVLAAIREVCTRVCARGAECVRLHHKARTEAKARTCAGCRVFPFAPQGKN